jgi:hypothetical protein
MKNKDKRERIGDWEIQEEVKVKKKLKLEECGERIH